MYIFVVKSPKIPVLHQHYLPHFGANVYTYTRPELLHVRAPSLVPYRRRFATRLSYNLDDPFHGAKGYSKPQDVSKILTFVNKIMSTDMQENY